MKEYFVFGCNRLAVLTVLASVTRDNNSDLSVSLDETYNMHRFVTTTSRRLMNCIMRMVVRTTLSVSLVFFDVRPTLTISIRPTHIRSRWYGKRKLISSEFLLAVIEALTRPSIAF